MMVPSVIQILLEPMIARGGQETREEDAAASRDDQEFVVLSEVYNNILISII